MRKLKGGMRGSKLSTRRFIPWFGLPQRRLYIHVVEALTKSIVSQQSSLFRGHRVTTVTLIPIATKELLHKGWGSPRPPHKECRRRSTPSRRVVDMPRVTKTPRRPAHRDLLAVHSRTSSQGTTPCNLTH